jgi:NAD(P)-dependent dehydrogenase (short-subunit alcohol dehydrogenase family)
MIMRLQNKVALVTGAGAGIGRAIAETFAREGAKVVVNDLNADTAKAVVDGINKAGGTAASVQADVSKEADAVKIVKFTVDTYGSLDILVNNAGIELIKPTHELTEQDWDSVMNVNLKGCFLVSKHGVIQMLAQGGGSIINMASAAGLIGFPLLASYCATKGGVVQLTKSMALEYRPANVRVNAICPSLIETDLGDRFVESYKAAGIPAEELLMSMQGRMGTVEDVAGAALFLASDDASFVNGVTLPVDGGACAG